MKRGIQIVVLFSILLGFSSCKKQKPDILYNKKYVNEIKEVRSDFATFMRGNFIPGASIAVSINGEIIYSEAMGFASRELNVKATRKTKFRTGDLSELYTAFMYHKMVEEGVLHPDSTIQHYYPEFPEKESPITIDMLVQHSSGIRKPKYTELSWRGLNINLEKGLDNFKDDPLMAPPGYYQATSIFNYNLLGVVMEKAKNKSFAELLKSYVTDTLHLMNTSIDNPIMNIENRSCFFDHNIVSQVTNAVWLDLRHRAPSDGILSNAEDMVKLGNAYLSSNYFSEETRQRIFTKTPLASGAEADLTNGWLLLTDQSGNLIYGKDGSVAGGSASILIYPEEKLVIACATNLTSATENLPIFKFARIFSHQNETVENSEE